MKATSLLLAQVDRSHELLDKATRGTGFSGATDSLIILGFIVVLALALFCWAYFIRKRPTEAQGAHALVRPKRSKRAHRGKHSRQRDSESSSSSPESGKRMRRRRRRGKGELRRNPTLEETGGLPPVRSETGSGHASSAPPSL